MPKKEKVGVVVSDVMDKTVVIEVPEYRPHPKYKKIIEQNKKYHANDIQSVCNKGDKVLIVEDKPTSKTKRWRVVEVVEKAK